MARLDKDELGKYMEADPRVSPWGIYNGDPWAFGTKVFFWFATEAELRERLADGSFDVDGEAEGWEPAAEGMKNALAEIKEISSSDVETLDAATNGGFKIHWLGRFEELLIGDSPVALEVREAWRESMEVPFEHPPAPIEANEVEDFVAFLKEYGF